MKKLCSFFFLLALPSFALAQHSKKYTKRTIAEKARYYTKQMIDSLELNSEQEESVFHINLEVSKRFDQMFKDSSISVSERKPLYRSIYQYRDSSLRQCLDRKQFLHFLDIEMDRRDKKKKKKLD